MSVLRWTDLLQVNLDAVTVQGNDMGSALPGAIFSGVEALVVLVNPEEVSGGAPACRGCWWIGDVSRAMCLRS